MKKIIELDEMPKDFIIINEDLIIVGTGLKYQQGDEQRHEGVFQETQR